MADRHLQEWHARLESVASETVAAASGQIRTQVESTAKPAAARNLEASQARLEELTAQTIAESSHSIRTHLEGFGRPPRKSNSKLAQARLQENFRRKRWSLPPHSNPGASGPRRPRCRREKLRGVASTPPGRD